tara:strand:+ start:3374 stop:3679 length:306 start_codon:yes stop_codon:yes gene_type:complete
MKVLTPSETTQNISLIPRFAPSGTITIDTYNEFTKATTSQTVIYAIDGGVLNAVFDLECSEMDRFTFSLSDSNGVFYRCKALATTQELDKIQLTKNKYKYA